MAFFIKLHLYAYDTQFENRRGYTNLTITIKRNPNAPQFKADVYEKTIQATLPIGEEIVQIEATDGDNVCFIFKKTLYS